VSQAGHKLLVASVGLQAVRQPISLSMTDNNSQATGAARHVYLRLMRRRRGEVAVAGEALELAGLLGAAPGALAAQVVERHPKGGYRVTVNLTWSSLDEFIAYLESRDWMSVV